jgi:hypothetical protein
LDDETCTKLENDLAIGPIDWAQANFNTNMEKTHGAVDKLSFYMNAFFNQLKTKIALENAVRFKLLSS